MAWPRICALLSEGKRSSSGFRRESAVRTVVETLGPGDARYHVGRILKSGPELLNDPRVRSIDSWGDPIRCPGIILGTPRSFSPTTLRYLSHALWLRDNQLVDPGGHIVEIGVGFGGLAAMNAIVSGAHTHFVDLSPVTATAMRMLAETGLGIFGSPANEVMLPERYCVVSNYAFSELNKELQDDYLRLYLKNSSAGLIVSNASVFAETIGGRDDARIEAMLRSAGLDSNRRYPDLPLGPTDYLAGVNIHVWRKRIS